MGWKKWKRSIEKRVHSPKKVFEDFLPGGALSLPANKLIVDPINKPGGLLGNGPEGLRQVGKWAYKQSDVDDFRKKGNLQHVGNVGEDKELADGLQKKEYQHDYGADPQNSAFGFLDPQHESGLSADARTFLNRRNRLLRDKATPGRKALTEQR